MRDHHDLHNQQLPLKTIKESNTDYRIVYYTYMKLKLTLQCPLCAKIFQSPSLAGKDTLTLESSKSTGTSDKWDTELQSIVSASLKFWSKVFCLNTLHTVEPFPRITEYNYSPFPKKSYWWKIISTNTGLKWKPFSIPLVSGLERFHTISA